VAGQQPQEADLEVCQKQSYRGDLSCWNGQRSDRPHCGPQGSLNIPFYAETGLGNYKWVADVCRVEAEEGNFGKENGSPGAFYYGGIVGCKALAYRELKEDFTEDAAAVRRAIRSNLAWDALSSYPMPRCRDEVNEAGQVRTASGWKARLTLTVAIAGMRWSTKGRGKMTSEDSHSQVLSDALNGKVPALTKALTPKEIDLLKATLHGDVESAREVSSWMFGTIGTPEPNSVVWAWRLRRTTLGAESVFLGRWPNPMKPMRVVTAIDRNGLWKGMRPSPKGLSSGWARCFEVHIENGVIHSSCSAGESQQEELGGDILWEVKVEGRKVQFLASGIA
jgi:hypothetical protein